MPKVAENVTAEFAKEFASLSHGERGEALARFCSVTGVSRQQAYRYLSKYNVITSKQTRNDAGRCVVTREQAAQIAAIKETSRRKTGSVTMPTTVALEIARENGILTEEVSAGYMNDVLRRYGLDSSTLSRSDGVTPEMPLERKSNWPTEWYLADVSVCLQYRFGKKNQHLQFEPVTRFYGKDVSNYSNKKNYLLRYVIVDHLTSNFYVRYYYAAGENGDDWIDFLLRAFFRKEEPLSYPFEGVPHNLFTDKGSSIGKSAKVQNLMNALGIKHTTHMPGNPRAKSMSETYQNVWQQQFESRLALEPAKSPEELNERAEKHLIYIHHTKQMRRRQGKTRAELWNMGVAIIPEGKHRVLPQERWNDIRALAHQAPEERVVTGSRISFNGPQYRIEESSLRGEKVKVYPCPYRRDVLIVLHGEEKYEAYRIEDDPFGFATDAIPLGEYRRAKDSQADKAQKELKQVDLSNIDPFKIPEIEAPASIAARTPKTEIEIGTENPIIPQATARDKIYSALGRDRFQALSTEIDLAFEGRDGIKRSELEALLEDLTCRETQKHA
ncbi:MAG: hypothetical protein JW737_00280 [Acidobacteria bacterium]|nr:hypothetical protein [Acidobacteriota bacterium]